MDRADSPGANRLGRQPLDVSRGYFMELAGKFDADYFFKRKLSRHEHDSALARSKIDQRILAIVDVQPVQRRPHLLPIARLIPYRGLGGCVGDDIEVADLANAAGISAIFLVEPIDARCDSYALSSAADVIGDIICGKPHRAERPMPTPRIPQP